jgi:hypothetical protein
MNNEFIKTFASMTTEQIADFVEQSVEHGLQITAVEFRQQAEQYLAKADALEALARRRKAARQRK